MALIIQGSFSPSNHPIRIRGFQCMAHYLGLLVGDSKVSRDSIIMGVSLRRSRLLQILDMIDLVDTANTAFVASRGAA